MDDVSQLLQAKGGKLWTVESKTSVFDALKLMAERNIGSLMVCDGGKLVGIFSERDYARKVILKGKSSKDLPVGKIMSTKVLVVKPAQTVEECMALMTDKRVRHLPVMDGDALVGVVSIGDVVKSVIGEREFMIQQLTNYITGDR